MSEKKKLVKKKIYFEAISEYDMSKNSSALAEPMDLK